MKRRVALVESSILDQYPLVSGYLHAYAQADPVVDDAFDFVYYTPPVERVGYEEALTAIRALRALIICVRCYVWNMGLVRRLIRDLSDDPTVERISGFASYLQANIGRSEYAGLVQSILAEQEHGALMTAGRLGTHLAHEARLGAQCDVASFVMGLDAGDPSRRLALVTLWTSSMSSRSRLRDQGADSW